MIKRWVNMVKKKDLVIFDYSQARSEGFMTWSRSITMILDMHHGNTTEFFAVPHKYHGNCSVQVLWDYNLISPCHHYSHIAFFFLIGCFRLFTKKQSSAYIIMHMLLRVFHSTLYSIQSVYSPLPECLRQIFRDPLSRNSRQEFHRLVQT